MQIFSLLLNEHIYILESPKILFNDYSNVMLLIFKLYINTMCITIDRCVSIGM